MDQIDRPVILAELGSWSHRAHGMSNNPDIGYNEIGDVLRNIVYRVRVGRHVVCFEILNMEGFQD